MGQEALTYSQLVKIMRLLQGMSRDDLKRKAALLIVKHFPDYKESETFTQDVSRLISYERDCRAGKFSHLV
jgi:hypothetical protein